MSTSKESSPSTPRFVELATTASRARSYIDASRSPATLRAYRSDWAHFESWCSEHNLVALPAEPAVVAMYLTDLADSGDFKAVHVVAEVGEHRPGPQGSRSHVADVRRDGSVGERRDS